MAKYPSRTEIVTAMGNPHVSFKSSKLIGGSAIKRGTRFIQYSGGYTSVFPFNTVSTGKKALRCWTADIGDAKIRSQKISQHLESLNSDYFAGFKYVDNAILINGDIHPVVLMDWVEGETLKEYINNNIDNASKLIELANNFKAMVKFFHDKNIAHGDLQHGNVMVRADGSLVAIDYDSMYIPSLDGMTDAIKGLPGYQHPSRMKNKTINNKLDYFSELVIYLSILVYADQSSLWSDYYETEDLLFSNTDFNNPKSSNLINDLLKSTDQTIIDITNKLKEQLEISDILQLSPLEDILVDKQQITKESIFDKWDKQPNGSIPNVVTTPKKGSITSKF